MFRLFLPRRALVVLVAILIAVIVALYPVLDCGDGGCPQAVHSSSGTAMSTCLLVVLAALPAASARASERTSYRSENLLMRNQAHLSPEPRPPRTFL